MSFTTLCIQKLMTYGCITAETHALGRLLDAARLYCGVDKHGEIDALSGIANRLCAEQPAEREVFTSPAADPAPQQSSATPPAERRPTVFVSYSHANDVFAQKLVADLNKAGHATWIDTSAIKGGADWQRAICDGINLSYTLVVICTHKALESEYVWDEIQWARTRHKHILPALLEDVIGDDRFFGLHRYQGIRFDRLAYEAAVAELLASLGPAPEYDPGALARVPSRREYELAYLDRLRFDDFRLEKFELAEYAALAGVSQQQNVSRDGWQALAMQQEFAVIRAVKRDSEELEGAPEAFTDAVSRISELRRVVVLGEPGAGKTHTLRAIAKPLYIAALNDPAAPIPLLVKLGSWDKADQPFAEFLRGALGELGGSLDELLEAKRAVLLLDGLNEFPADQRPHKYPQVEAFIQAHPDVMAVVTCREADYPISLHLNKVLIRPLDPLRIRDFARRALRLKSEDAGETFFWKLAGGDAIQAVWKKWERTGADFLLFWTAPDVPRENPNIYGVTSGTDDSVWREQVRNSASIMRLASNPYMLRMLLDVYIQYKGTLPANRGQLFDQFVTVLLEREKLARIDAATNVVTLTDEARALLVGLQQVAFQMQVRRAESGADDETSAGTSLDLAAVRDILNDRLLYLAVSSSILISGDDVRFSHQLLQEYFAAKYMDSEIQAGRLKAETIWKPEKWWERTNWEEAAILLAGLYSDDCSRMVEWVNAANPEAAALCVMRSGAALAEATGERLRREWLVRLTDTQAEPNPLARAAVGRALELFRIGGQTADNRSGVALRPDGLPNIDWVTIPAGEFIYGDDKKDYPNFAQPADLQVLTLPAFQISRYPITYEQFQAFIDDPEGFHDGRWWEGLALPKGHNSAPGEQSFQGGNHPCENVSWYDALAFCCWLSWRLGGGYTLDNIGAWAVRLPTEQEWEKAARGTAGRRYPYGDEFDAAKGNTSETGVGQTSAVGLFAEGDTSHWGKPISDLSGNVWEWCLTDYRSRAPRAEDENLRSDDSRVLRGGSWSYSQGLARAAFRNSNHPSNRFSLFGFRVVCRPPSPGH